MPEIAEGDLNDTYWATSEDVQSEIDIPQKRDQQPDYDDFIEKATRRVQAWWSEAMGKEPSSSNLPDPSGWDEGHLLRQATALEAASRAHGAKAQQRRSSTDDEDNRSTYLHRSARQVFNDWKTTQEVAQQSKDSNDTGSVPGRIGEVDPLE